MSTYVFLMMSVAMMSMVIIMGMKMRMMMCAKVWAAAKRREH